MSNPSRKAISAAYCSRQVRATVAALRRAAEDQERRKQAYLSLFDRLEGGSFTREWTRLRAAAVATGPAIRQLRAEVAATRRHVEIVRQARVVR